MNVDRAVFIFAGSMLLISLALAWLVSPYWLLFTAFVGLNLVQSAFTGFCPAAIVFRRLGLKEGPAFEWPPASPSSCPDRIRYKALGLTVPGNSARQRPEPKYRDVRDIVAIGWIVLRNWTGCS